MRAAVSGTIAEIENAGQAATAEILSIKAGEKLMAARARKLAGEAGVWRRRAEEAVRVRADLDEQAQVAAELLRGRRELDATLQRLKRHEGTVAAGLAAARGGETPLATEGPAWDRFEEAEHRIEEEAIVADVGGGEIDEAELAEQKLHEQAQGLRTEQALAELKRKMKDRSFSGAAPPGRGMSTNMIPLESGP